jgi:hypothetical protein
MSRRELVGAGSILVLSGVLSGTAFAQGVSATGEAAADDAGAVGVPADPPEAEVGVSGLPGGDRVGYAETFPRGTVSTSFTAGYGYRSGLLGSGHTMSRGAASAALAYSVADFLTVGLLLDGRYDKHTGTGFADHGWVGEPRIHVRAGKRAGTLAFGGELTVWMPGKDAPSLVPAATSVDARALVSKRLGSGLVLAANAGFRLDNSAESVDLTRLMDFSTMDQASLGVSQWNAVVAGARVGYPTGKLTIAVEGAVDLYVGGPDGRPGPTISFGGSASYRLTANLSAELFVGANIQDKPTETAGVIPLIPYAPLVTGGVGLHARFGGPSKERVPDDGDVVKTTCDDPDPGKRPDDCPDEPPPAAVAVLAGTVTDDGGTPISGATVTVTDCDGKTATATTDAKGKYRVEGLRPCDATIAIEAAGRVAQSEKVTLREGDNDGPSTPMPALVKPGRFQFVIRSFSTGKGVAAEIEINPGGIKVSAAADGSTELSIAPGTYTLRITSPGLKEQTREYVVTENNNFIVNVDLRK